MKNNFLLIFLLLSTFSFGQKTTFNIKYSEQLANAHKINELQKGQLSVTKILAWLTGVASVYYLIEIVKFLNSFCHFWAVKK